MTTSRLRETIPLEVKVNGLKVIRSVAPFGQFAFSVCFIRDNLEIAYLISEVSLQVESIASLNSSEPSVLSDFQLFLC